MRVCCAKVSGERSVTLNPSVPPDKPSSGSLESKLSPLQKLVTSTALETPPEPPQEIRYSGGELWLHRITVLMFVFVCAVVGVLLVILPWRPEWMDNHFLFGSPGLRALMANGFVRGLCSGLGLLDIWIGFWEAIHYHEIKKA
jgi:hypothetical protein